MVKLTSALSISVLAGWAGLSLAAESPRIPVNFPQPEAGQYVHVPPTLADLDEANIHPELKRVIRRGHDLFVNTQQLRGENVFNDMNCSSCHLGDGAQPFSAPVWPAAVVLPNFRSKNQQVNSLEERIAGCFSFSMNGKPPEYGSDNLLALAAYHQWLAKGVPIYQAGNSLYGRGYPIVQPDTEPSYERGQALYEANCSICHAEDGGGSMVGDNVQFPAVWGDTSYNWGAGISRINTLAGFIHNNMPLGQPRSMSVQDSWDLADYINSQERPQDPRYTGNVVETRALYLDTFHKLTYYGLEKQGRLLGDHDNLGEKDFLKPAALKPRFFE